MASSKLMASSNPRNSDLSRRAYPTASSSDRQTKNANRTNHNNISINNSNTLIASSSTSSTMTIDGLLRDVYGSIPSSESTLLDAQITLIETPVLAANTVADPNQTQMINQNAEVDPPPVRKSVDDVWREIVSGERKEMKVEAADEMMTLEDFLAKAGAVDEDEVKMPPATPLMERLSGGVYSFDPSPLQVLDKVEGSIIGFGNGVEVVAGEGGSGGVGRGKRGRGAVFEPLDKAAQQRQRRMIKNRESAARSRERKQAYQVELESLAVRLEEENEQLLKEKDERTKERFKQLMEKVIPIVEKKRPRRVLRRVHSMQW
ncbi:G-box-binding factor 4 isoform X1 [Tripterygium wilfordii]|uniref:G-box-binding factor 4 isoform X1 n=1 Tax=Tripterygium wilfordii TaxID=458696 RepID=A0A7J7CMX4_TRIWF|nr:G-box-binding factor 4-like [Tripterygium wilfordii]KAF5735348.1 G-box-binding factor 4 isoform X1 [Tripterygium wilfordii]